MQLLAPSRLPVYLSLLVLLAGFVTSSEAAPLLGLPTVLQAGINITLPAELYPGTRVTFSTTLVCTTYAWTFGEGAEPNASTAAAPSVVLRSPDTYTATCLCNGMAPPESLDYEVEALSSHVTAVRELDGSTGRHQTAAVIEPGGSVAIASHYQPRVVEPGLTAKLYFDQFNPRGSGTFTERTPVSTLTRDGTCLDALVVGDRTLLTHTDANSAHLFLSFRDGASGSWTTVEVDGATPTRRFKNFHSIAAASPNNIGISYAKAPAEGDPTGLFEIWFAEGTYNGVTRTFDWARSTIVAYAAIDGARVWSDVVRLGVKWAVVYTQGNEILLRIGAGPAPTWTPSNVTTGLETFDASPGLCAVVEANRLAVAFPALVCGDRSSQRLLYARANRASPGGPSDWTLHAVTPPEVAAAWPSLTFHDGRPAIAYLSAKAPRMIRLAWALTPEADEASDWCDRVVFDYSTLTTGTPVPSGISLIWPAANCPLISWTEFYPRAGTDPPRLGNLRVYHRATG